MTDVTGALLIVVGIQAIAIVALLVHQARRGHAYRALARAKTAFASQQTVRPSFYGRPEQTRGSTS